MALSTPANLSGVTSDVLDTTIVTGTISPSDNALLIVAVSQTQATAQAVSSITTTLSNVGTWTIVQTNVQWASGPNRFTTGAIAYAMVTGDPGSGTITATFAANTRGKVMRVAELTGHNTTTPVAQNKTNTGTTTTLTVTLDSTPNSANMVYAMVTDVGLGSITAGSGFTEIGETTLDGSIDSTIQTQYDYQSADTTADWSTLAGTGNVGIAIEINEASGGPVETTKTFTIDGIVKAETTGSFTIDGIVKASTENTFTIDGIVKVLDNTSTFTIDGIVKVLDNTASFTIDGIVEAETAATFTIDGIVKASTESTFTIDGIVFAENTNTFTIDGIVKALDNTATFTIDGIVTASFTHEFTIDGIVKVLDNTATFTIDGIVKVLDNTQTFTIDGLVKTLDNENTFTIDGIVKTLDNPATFTLDGIVKALDNAQTFTIDGIVSSTGQVENTFTIDGIVKAATEATFTIDAVVQGQITTAPDGEPEYRGIYNMEHTSLVNPWDDVPY